MQDGTFAPGHGLDVAHENLPQLGRLPCRNHDPGRPGGPALVLGFRPGRSRRGPAGRFLRGPGPRRRPDVLAEGCRNRLPRLPADPGRGLPAALLPGPGRPPGPAGYPAPDGPGRTLAGQPAGAGPGAGFDPGGNGAGHRPAPEPGPGRPGPGPGPRQGQGADGRNPRPDGWLRPDGAGPPGAAQDGLRDRLESDGLGALRHHPADPAARRSAQLWLLPGFQGPGPPGNQAPAGGPAGHQLPAAGGRGDPGGQRGEALRDPQLHRRCGADHRCRGPAAEPESHRRTAHRVDPGGSPGAARGGGVPADQPGDPPAFGHSHQGNPGPGHHPRAGQPHHPHRPRRQRVRHRRQLRAHPPPRRPGRGRRDGVPGHQPGIRRPAGQGGRFRPDPDGAQHGGRRHHHPERRGVARSRPRTRPPNGCSAIRRGNCRGWPSAC